MTLQELSADYRAAADSLRQRIRELRAAERAECDPEAVRALHVRRSALEPLAREMSELASLTAHYYERRYHRNGKYTV